MSRIVCHIWIVVACCQACSPWALGQTESGSLRFWGQDFGPPPTFTLDSRYVAVAAGSYHSMALDADGMVVAWGENGSGQCDVPDERDIVAIAAGFYHSLALRSDGSISVWGDNARGQRNAPSAGEFLALAAGHWHSLAIRSDGSLVGWGWNDFGQCDVPSGGGFAAVCAGLYHSLALRWDGSVVAWGGDGDGQCDVPAGHDFTAIAAGALHSLGLRSDGSLAAWGRNDDGQCDVPEGGGFVAIAAGAFHSLALRSDGSVIAWGHGSYGQCDVPIAAYMIAIAAGGFRSLGIETERPTMELTEPIDFGVDEPGDADTAATEAVPDVPEIVRTEIERAEPTDANSLDAVVVDPNAADSDAAAVTDANAVEPDPVDVAEVVPSMPVDANAVESVEPNVPALTVAAVVPPTDANAVASTETARDDSGSDVSARAGSAEPNESAAPKPSQGRTAGLFEGLEFYTGAGTNSKSARPVYHFTSQTLTPHFYTISKQERDRLIDEQPDVWTYEGVAFYAYPEGGQPDGAVPVYRFWSELLSTHFYTIDENEKNAYIRDYPDLCTYQGVAWYADKPGGAATDKKTEE